MVTPSVQLPIKHVILGRGSKKEKAEGVGGVAANLGEVSETLRSSEENHQKINSISYLHVSKKKVGQLNAAAKRSPA